MFALTSFDAGRVTRHTLRTTKDVRIGTGPSDVYTAVLVETNLGDKIVLLRSGGTEHRWWSRVFDADPPVTAEAATSRPALPDFQIKCRKPDDAVRVSTEGGRVVFDITSGSGIGGATIGRAGQHWPDEVVLRVHLKGLESLRMAGGGAAVRVSVLSHNGHPRLLHLQRGDEREGPELTKGDAGWTDVRAMDAEGKIIDGLPGEGGWFEMVVPRVVLSDEGDVDARLDRLLPAVNVSRTRRRPGDSRAGDVRVVSTTWTVGVTSTRVGVGPASSPCQQCGGGGCGDPPERGVEFLPLASRVGVRNLKN